MPQDRKQQDDPQEQGRIDRTTRTETSLERRGGEPDADATRDPDAVWSSGETTPHPAGSTPGAPGRVADAGDLGKANPQPWSTEAQADALARQTRRDEEPRPAEKPRR